MVGGCTGDFMQGASKLSRRGGKFQACVRELEIAWLRSGTGSDGGCHGSYRDGDGGGGEL